MNERIKYLNLLVMLAFLVGQVQYAYTSYFCTMKQTQVSVASTTMASAEDDQCSMTCNQCEGIAQVQSRHELVQANCIQVRTAEKKVVDNFTDWGRANFHFATAFVIPHLQNENQRQGNQNPVFFSQVESPPLDLPILNSNLRI